MKFNKCDNVLVVSGKDRGKKGKVTQTLVPDKIVVDGVNKMIKHVKPRREGEKGQRIQFPAPRAVGNVMLICPKCNKSTRVAYKLLETDVKGRKKVRICKKCNEAID